MFNKKTLNPEVTELFIRGRKLNISLAFITQSYFVAPKNIRLNCMHYFYMKFPNKKVLQQIAIHHFSNIDFRKFKKNLLQSFFLFQLLMILLRQIILHVFERIL